MNKSALSIPMTAVRSSNVRAHGYDADTQTLAVHFKSGGVYHYANVPPEVAAALHKATSVGGFIASDIRPNFTAVLQHKGSPAPRALLPRHS